MRVMCETILLRGVRQVGQLHVWPMDINDARGKDRGSDERWN